MRLVNCFFQFVVTVCAEVFPSYVFIITKVMVNVLSKKEGKDKWQSILGYFFMDATC